VALLGFPATAPSSVVPSVVSSAAVITVVVSIAIAASDIPVSAAVATGAERWAVGEPAVVAVFAVPFLIENTEDGVLSIRLVLFLLLLLVC